MSNGLLLFLTVTWFVMGVWTVVEFIVSLFHLDGRNRVALAAEAFFWFYLVWVHVKLIDYKLTVKELTIEEE